jgi:hypothetical protein
MKQNRDGIARAQLLPEQTRGVEHRPLKGQGWPNKKPPGVPAALQKQSAD